MTYIKDNLSNTSLPTLVIEEEKCHFEYPQIGYGNEGSVHKYNDKIAFKIFTFTKNKENLPKKFEKIELLGHINDEAACFPIGLVGYEDRKKEGYYYDLVNKHKEYESFWPLQFLKDTKKLIEYIIQADEAIQRFHKMGIILGDIKDDNILIDSNENVKFVDTDNWMYNGYDFDLEPGRASWLSNTFKKNFSLIDNDRFVFGIMAIQYFLDGSVVCRSDNYFKKMIEFMDVSQEVKDGLRLIFSDANEKPYIGPILKKINPDQEIISKEEIYRLNRIF